MDATTKLARAYRAILVLGVTALGLAALSVVLLVTRLGSGPVENAALYDPDVRRAALQELVHRGSGQWDTFPDPTVARMLQPGLVAAPRIATSLGSNDLGLRERLFSLPKTRGTLRVVLLGDSFVMGAGVRAEDRLGVFLAELLRRNAKAGHPPIECLHFGLGAWNILAECAFLRRQLSLAQPDLVVQIVVRNDLGDNPGARGMGTLSTWWPRRPERADSLFDDDSPRLAFGTRAITWLSFGFDWESRSRLEESGREIARLAGAVEKAGGRYLLLNDYASQLALAQQYFAAGLRSEQSVPFASSFSKEERYRISAQDGHWSRAGHEQVALFLYEVIRARGLLPQLELPVVAAAADVVHRLLPEAEAEVRESSQPRSLLSRRAIASEIDFGAVTDMSAAQVHGGVIRGGIVSAYASLMLRCEGRTRLSIRGRGLGRPEIDGVKVVVYVEATQVGTLAPVGAEPFEAAFDVPAELASRAFVSVRFQADDYAYALPDLRACHSFRLERVALTNG